MAEFRRPTSQDDAESVRKAIDKALETGYNSRIIEHERECCIVINENKLREMMDFCVSVTERNIADFSDDFPNSQSTDYVYGPSHCKEWTDGFWCGMLALSYEYTKKDIFRQTLENLNEILKKRIENKIEVNHHDMGFIYSLSSVAQYKLFNSESAKDAALKAADNLLERFHEKGGFIQAWGDMGDPNNYSLIIDSLLNQPLLFWATEVSGDEKYAETAKKHIKAALNNVVRSDGTTFHRFSFDPETGAPVSGMTAQGYSDSSCWARGQAWGVCGTALCYAYTKDDSLPPVFRKVTDRFISLLPKDGVPYWDMIFSDGSGEPRDTSSAAIAICGILEMDKYFHDETYIAAAEKMLVSLYDNYSAVHKKNTNVILTDAMYSRPAGHKPEGAIYGDYFFMEALMRLINRDWKMYW